MRTMAVAVLVLAASIARADVELKNDSFESGGAVTFQAGFAANEIAAARFVLPDPNARLIKVQMLFGPDMVARNVTLKVFDDTAGTDEPGAEVASEFFQLTGSSEGIQELAFLGPIAVPQQFRVGIVLPGGVPSVANDNDAPAPSFPERNYIKESNLGWRRSTTFGVKGDWVIRAFVTGGAAEDAGAGGNDAGTDGGGGGGGCCQSSGAADVLVALALLGLVMRRRS